MLLRMNLLFANVSAAGGRLLAAALLGCLCWFNANDVAAAAQPSAHKGRAEHVVVVVWDGMRPDFITPQYTPTLYQLAQEGVFFRNHHPAYISSTEVNGTAIA